MIPRSNRSPSYMGLTSKSISLLRLPHSQIFITCYIKSNLTPVVGPSPAFLKTTYILLTYKPERHALEKEMATHSSILAWRIPGTEEPGGLLSMGSQSQTRLKQLSSSSSSKPEIYLRKCVKYV